MPCWHTRPDRVATLFVNNALRAGVAPETWLHWTEYASSYGFPRLQSSTLQWVLSGESWGNLGEQLASESWKCQRRQSSQILHDCGCAHSALLTSILAHNSFPPPAAAVLLLPIFPLAFMCQLWEGYGLDIGQHLSGQNPTVCGFVGKGHKHMWD